MNSDQGLSNFKGDKKQHKCSQLLLLGSTEQIKLYRFGTTLWIVNDFSDLHLISQVFYIWQIYESVFCLIGFMATLMSSCMQMTGTDRAREWDGTWFWIWQTQSISSDETSCIWAPVTRKCKLIHIQYKTMITGCDNRRKWFEILSLEYELNWKFNIYSPSCCSKPECLHLFCETQKKIYIKIIYIELYFVHIIQSQWCQVLFGPQHSSNYILCFTEEIHSTGLERRGWSFLVPLSSSQMVDKDNFLILIFLSSYVFFSLSVSQWQSYGDSRFPLLCKGWAWWP